MAEFNQEKSERALLRRNCTWIFDGNQSLARPGRVRYTISLDKEKRAKEKGFITGEEFSNLDDIFAFLNETSKVRLTTFQCLGYSYNFLLHDDSQKFILNIFEYPHIDTPENHR